MLVVVLFVMVGEEINEMQLAGWIGTTTDPRSEPARLDGHVVLDLPQRRDDRRPGGRGGWLVVGSFLAAQYMPRLAPASAREQVARRAEAPPAVERAAERTGTVVTAPQ